MQQDVRMNSRVLQGDTGTLGFYRMQQGIKGVTKWYTVRKSTTKCNKQFQSATVARHHKVQKTDTWYHKVLQGAPRFSNMAQETAKYNSVCNKVHQATTCAARVYKMRQSKTRWWHGAATCRTALQSNARSNKLLNGATRVEKVL